ncbi:MAG: PhoU domain-containing protein [Ilumatobacteraceae bacterium]
MVLSFFRKGPTGLDHVISRAVGMLGDARHSFDLATLALLTDTAIEAVDRDIRDTDARINQTEFDLRTELVVHVSVQGALDIGSVLGLMLLIKKIERIGDQAKNVLDLAEAGAAMGTTAEVEELLAERATISALFGEVADLMTEPDEAHLADLTRRCRELETAHQAKILEYMHSDAPGHVVVPRAIYYRYLKRIVANLVGVVREASEPELDRRAEQHDADE